MSVPQTYDFDQETGHDFTHLEYRLGRCHYICENCGAYMVIEHLNQVVIFHSPAVLQTSLQACTTLKVPPDLVTLKQKIEEVNRADWARLASEI